MTDGPNLPRMIAEALLSREGTGPAWGIVIDEAAAGYARISMEIRREMTNGHGMVHGGMTFALADTAFAYACNSHNVATVSQSASIAYLSSAHEGETLVAEARVTARAGRSATCLVTVSTADGRIVAQLHGLAREIGGTIIDI